MIIKKKKDTSYLFTAYVHDFNDNYHRDSTEPSSELERDARKLRRRYRDYHEYINAKRTYNEYMEYVYQKVGSKKLFKFLRESGSSFDIFIPHKPRMKSTAYNRDLEKYECPISKVNMRNSEEAIEEATMIAINTSNNYIPVEFKELNGKDEKQVEEFLKNSSKGSGGSYERISKVDPLDYLEEFFKKESKTKKGSMSDYDEVESVSLTELLSTDIYKQDSEYDKNEAVYFRNTMMTRDAVEELQLLDKLNELGWNTLAILKNTGGASKGVTRILKKRKRDAKKDKKAKKKAKKQADSFLLGAARDNGYDDYRDYSQEMQDFSMHNLYK